MTHVAFTLARGYNYKPVGRSVRKRLGNVYSVSVARLLTKGGGGLSLADRGRGGKICQNLADVICARSLLLIDNIYTLLLLLYLHWFECEYETHTTLNNSF